MFSIYANRLLCIQLINWGLRFKYAPKNSAVTFPFAGCCQNQAIFGTVHQSEISRKALLRRSFTFRQQTDLFSLAGRAAVTSVTIQYMSGKTVTLSGEGLKKRLSYQSGD